MEIRRVCPHKEKINAYLDGELSSWEQEQLRAHLEECPLCRKEFESLHATRQLLASIPSPERPAAYWDYYETRLRERIASLGNRTPVSRWVLRYAIVALAMLMLTVGIVSGRVSPIKIEVLANAPGASVYIDGELKGITPLEITVSSGYHSISLHKEGYQTWEHSILASTVSPMRIEVRLLPRAFTESPKEVRQFAYLSLSPNGENLALLGSKRNFQPGTGELWIYNFGKKSLTKLKEGVGFVRPAWSPDSKRLAFVSVEPQGDVVTALDLETGVIRTTGPLVGLSQLAWLDKEKLAFISGERPNIQVFEILAQNTYAIPTAPIERFTPSPDGSWIAYNSAQDGKIYLLSLTTQVSKELPLEPREYFALSWSPDGRFLALASKTGLYLWDLVEEKETPILNEEGIDLAWADDGRLFFLSRKDDSYALDSFDPANQKISQLIEDRCTMESLTVTPSSSFLLFSSNEAGFFRIYQKDLLKLQDRASPLLPGSNLSISSTPQAAEIYLSGNYLGRTPTVLSSLEAGSYEITLKKENYSPWSLSLTLSEGEFKEVKAVLVPPQTQEPVTRTEGEKREAAVAPNGKWLAYSEGPEEDSSLYFLDLSNDSFKYLGSGRQPSWSSDGSRLYFTRGFRYSDIWTYDPGSGEFRQLTFTGGAQNPIPSPGGGWVAYLSGLSPQTLSLWLMNEDGGDQRLLVQDQGPVYKFNWSPDGKLINYLVHKSGLDYSYFTDLEGNTRLLKSGAGLSLCFWEPEGKFLAFLSYTELEREICIYYASNLEPYLTQKVGQSEFPIFWRSGKIHWAQKEGEQMQVYSMDLEEGKPENIWSSTGVRILGYSSELDRLIVAASWNGYSQLYLLPLRAP
jgi:Tol biopolymer transport system component